MDKIFFADKSKKDEKYFAEQKNSCIFATAKKE